MHYPWEGLDKGVQTICFFISQNKKRTHYLHKMVDDGYNVYAENNNALF